jgi:putative acetyltransferase
VRKLTSDILIRSESASDIERIFDLTKRAFQEKSFSDGQEQFLINALRDQGALELSLVATCDGEIVGHVAFSPAIAQNGTDGWFALGPIAVEPALQRLTIGARLISKGLALLAEKKARGCVVIGDTNYYPRHGFVPRPDLAPQGESAAHFMVKSLDGLAVDTVLSFHPVFHGLGAQA